MTFSSGTHLWCACTRIGFFCMAMPTRCRLPPLCSKLTLRLCMLAMHHSCSSSSAAGSLCSGLFFHVFQASDESFRLCRGPADAALFCSGSMRPIIRAISGGVQRGGECTNRPERGVCDGGPGSADAAQSRTPSLLCADPAGDSRGPAQHPPAQPSQSGVMDSLRFLGTRVQT